MNVIASNEKNSKQIYLYTVLIQEISKIFTVQMPTSLVKRKKKLHSVLAYKFSTFYDLV